MYGRWGGVRGRGGFGFRRNWCWGVGSRNKQGCIANIPTQISLEVGEGVFGRVKMVAVNQSSLNQMKRQLLQ